MSDYRAARGYGSSHYWALYYADRCRRERERGSTALPVGLWALMTTVYGWQSWPDGYGTRYQPTNQPTN